MSDRMQNLFSFDFSKQNPGARQRVYERFMAAQEQSPFVLHSNDEQMELTEQELDMLSAAGMPYQDKENRTF